MDSLHDLRSAAHDHVLRNTVSPDADLQRAKQTEAAETWQAEQAAHEEFLDSLIIAPSVPNSDNPLQARPARLTKYLPDLTKRSARDRAAIERAKSQLAAKKENKKWKR